MHTVIGDRVHPHMGEGADVVVRAQVAAVDLAGVDGGALVHDAVLDEGVGADDAACPNDGMAPQDGAGQDDGPRCDLHVGCDLHGAAVDDHAVGDVLQQDRFTGGLGGVQTGTRCIQCSGRNTIFHGSGAPFRYGSRGTMRPGAPGCGCSRSFVPTKRMFEVSGIESCIQQTKKSRQKKKNLSNFLPFYITGKLGEIQVICIKNTKQIRDFAWWQPLDFLV